MTSVHSQMPVSARLASATLILLTLGLVGSACGDGQPAFCAPLSKAADMSGISAALRAGDLSEATTEASQLRQLASQAPPEIRADFVAVADSVREIVDLLATERQDGQIDPGQFERRRKDLNKRLGEIDSRSDRIRVWTSEQCGIELQ